MTSGRSRRRAIGLPHACALVLVTIGLAVASVPGAALARSSPLSLSERVIKHGEFAGFGPFGTPQTTLIPDASSWISGDSSYSAAEASATIAALRREGFKSALVEQLGTPTKNWAGVSWVVQLGSAGSARVQLAADVRHWIRADRKLSFTYKAFRAGAIPGAQGFFLKGTPNELIGDNVEFADGSFLYLVGDGWVPGTKKTPPRAALIRAAGKLYARVRGHPAR